MFIRYLTPSRSQPPGPTSQTSAGSRVKAASEQAYAQESLRWKTVGKYSQEEGLSRGLIGSTFQRTSPPSCVLVALPALVPARESRCHIPGTSLFPIHFANLPLYQYHHPALRCKAQVQGPQGRACFLSTKIQTGGSSETHPGSCFPPRGPSWGSPEVLGSLRLPPPRYLPNRPIIAL